jgi:hypothetical protein
MSLGIMFWGTRIQRLLLVRAKRLILLVFSLCELTEEVDIREVDITIGKNI